VIEPPAHYTLTYFDMSSRIVSINFDRRLKWPILRLKVKKYVARTPQLVRARPTLNPAAHLSPVVAAEKRIWRLSLRSPITDYILLSSTCLEEELAQG
jgi:hypothetical protein